MCIACCLRVWCDNWLRVPRWSGAVDLLALERAGRPVLVYTLAACDFELLHNRLRPLL